MSESGQDIYTLQIRRHVNPDTASPFCKACKNGYLHVNSLQVRQFTQTGKLPGVCKSCNVAFLKICRLQIRHLTQNEHHPHVCSKCGKSFTHAGNHRKHMLLHEKNELLEQNGLLVPKETHPKPPYKCEKCPRSFMKYGSYLKHMNNHANPVKYICIICEKEFKTKATLKTHSQLHKASEAKQSCRFCSLVFENSDALEEHFLKHVNEDNDKISSKVNVCKFCKIMFTVPERLEEHLQEHLRKQLEDENVDKALNEREEKEVKSEDGEERYKHYCSVCKKGFVNLGALKNHMSVHTGDLAFECKKCNRRFMHAFNLKKHVKSHVKRTHRCKVCSKVYRNVKLFKKHLSSHKQKK